MFIKRKSTNLFKKSATLSLMKMKNTAATTTKTRIEEKPTTPKKGRKATTTTGEVVEQ